MPGHWRRAGITPAYLSQIEIGNREGVFETMKRLVSALDVRLDDLVG